MKVEELVSMLQTMPATADVCLSVDGKEGGTDEDGNHIAGADLVLLDGPAPGWAVVYIQGSTNIF